VTAAPPPTTTCAAGRWKAEIFANLTLSGTPASVVCTDDIQTDWGEDGPAGVGNDNFSIRWTQVASLAAGSYSYRAVADDGMRASLDGASFFSAWRDRRGVLRARRRRSGSLRLHQGVRMSTTLTRPAPPREVPTPPAQVQQSSPNRLRRVLSFLAGLLAVGLGTVVTAINFDRYPTSFDDEGTYVAQAWALQHLGHLAHYTYWYDHPPVGWIQLAGWTSLTGAFDRAISGVAAGRELMIIIHAISCVLIWLICRELRANVVWSSLAVLLYSFSPLAIYFHRMVLLDNFSAVWLLLTLLMLVRRKRTLLAYAVAGFAFAMAVLSKETTALMLPIVLWAAWRGAHPEIRRYAMTLFIGMFGLLVAFYPLLATLKGELFPGPGHVSLWGGIMYQLADRSGSGTILDPNSGIWQTIDAWRSIDTLLIYVGVIASLFGLVWKRTRIYAVAVLLLLAIAARPGGYLPYPYIIGLLPFFALVPALIGQELTNLWKRGSAWARVVSVVGIGAIVAALIPLGVVWPSRVSFALTEDADRDYRATSEWLIKNTKLDDNIISDNVVWMELILDGHDLDSTIWHYKFDLDSEVVDRYPEGYKQMDYVVVSPVMRATGYLVPRVEETIAHSQVIQSYGGGQAVIEIRRVIKPGVMDTVEGLETLYGPLNKADSNHQPFDLAGWEEGRVMADWPIPELPLPGDAKLVSWGGRAWLIRDGEKVRYPATTADVSTSEDFASEWSRRYEEASP
jgi:hypothetical protein